MSTEITEVETPEERELELMSAKMTARYVAYETAKENLANFCFRNRIPTPLVRAEADRLLAEVEQTAREFQQLFDPYMRLKSRVEGWSHE